MDVIEASLHEQLQLEDIASAAGFSPFHFHRLFLSIVGETPRQFVLRLRVERSAALLLDQPESAVSDIAIRCGFSTASAFSRAFKEAFQMTPSEWRRSHDQVRSEGGSGDTNRVRTSDPANTIRRHSFDNRWDLIIDGLEPAALQICARPEMHVAYLRHTGNFVGNAAVFTAMFDQLADWARTALPATPETLAVYHDDPSITSKDQLRFSACVQIPATLVPTAPVSRTSLRGGEYAVGRFRLGESDYAKAWAALLADWLPSSGFETDDRPYVERFLGIPDVFGRREVEICIPVRKQR